MGVGLPRLSREPGLVKNYFERFCSIQRKTDVKNAIIGLKMILVMTLLVGLIYPLGITIIAGTIMSERAEGSLIRDEDRIIGSELIGQDFTKAIYFWPRPSYINYNPLISGGSNLGPTSKKLQEQVLERITKLNADAATVPAELVYASASGLDPHISLETAYFQMDRIAKARNILEAVRLRYFIDYVAMESEGDYVNVLKLNLGLDKQFPAATL